MQRELENLLPASMKKSDVKVVSSQNRKYLAWFGCSLFASLESFPETCIWKYEYDEGLADMDKFL